MESISYQRLRSKIEYIGQNLQVFDASLKSLSEKLKSEKDTNKHITDVLNLNKSSYNKLNQPLKEKDRLVSYSRSKMAEYSILELFGAFTIYMRDITEEMYIKDPMRIVGKVSSGSTMTYVEIIKLGNFDKIREIIVDEIFRKFENERSTIKLIDKLLSHTKVQIPESLKEMSLMYLEMRHLFIHNKGKADERFKNKYSEHVSLKAGNKLPTNFKTVTEAIDTVNRFAKSIDEQLIAEDTLQTN